MTTNHQIVILIREVNIGLFNHLFLCSYGYGPQKITIYAQGVNTTTLQIIIVSIQSLTQAVQKRIKSHLTATTPPLPLLSKVTMATCIQPPWLPCRHPSTRTCSWSRCRCVVDTGRARSGPTHTGTCSIRCHTNLPCVSSYVVEMVSVFLTLTVIEEPPPPSPREKKLN